MAATRSKPTIPFYHSSPAPYRDRGDESRKDEDDEEDEDLEVIGKTSTELAEYDREVVLQQEEDSEQLLVVGSSGGGGGSGSNEKKARRQKRKEVQGEAKTKASRRQERRRGRRSGNSGDDDDAADATEQRELLYQANGSDDSDENNDDGGADNHTNEKDDASPVGVREYTAFDEKKSRRRRRRARCSRFCTYCLVNLAIVIVLVGIVLGAYKATHTTKVRKQQHETKPARLVSNGTALFGATTVVISLDGFRADFLSRGLTPAMNALIAQGVSPKYMTPSFPSVTFPNHFTLLTGLYPESHGVVGNSFWDPSLKEEFYYTHTNVSMQAKWWTAEPLWVTAEDQGVSAAVHMWPGSEAHIPDTDPTYLDRFNASEALPRKVDRILELLDQPGWEKPETPYEQKRPRLIAAYVPNVDADGHLYGPNSTEIRQTIRDADDMVASLLAGLAERNLTEIVNVVIVSDHGMATTDVSRLLQLEDLVDTSLIEHIDGWPHYGLRPKQPADVELLYERLVQQQQQQQQQHGNGAAAFEVFLRDRNMPERYHFSRNDRIAPLWIFPAAGWAIVTEDELNVREAQARGDVYHPRGIHGYDHEHPLMRAIFIARGPAFPHAPGSRVAAFQNVEVYNILCDSLGIAPRPNNGTLRLPLTTWLPDSPDVADDADLIQDPPPSPLSSPLPPPSPRPTPPASARPSAGADNGKDDAPMTEDEEIEVIISWEDYLRQKYESWTHWLDGLLGIDSAELPPSSSL